MKHVRACDGRRSLSWFRRWRLVDASRWIRSGRLGSFTAALSALLIGGAGPTKAQPATFKIERARLLDFKRIQKLLFRLLQLGSQVSVQIGRSWNSGPAPFQRLVLASFRPMERHHRFHYQLLLVRHTQTRQVSKRRRTPQWRPVAPRTQRALNAIPMQLDNDH